ncbi:MAG: hypothetical protein QOF52_432 [Propionibacteriaceae bacterium]|jgi:membrane protein implicated in regulation of membrane protease activity|nr:hypothetical protein [Propionibacteriaceae bacterium]MDX6320574.1 hypothetical protein [Propionibacteriaceae bacterium]
MRQPDVVSLMTGLLLTAFAVGALWLAFTGSIDWNLVRVAAPVALVVVGVLGLALSRRRN